MRENSSQGRPVRAAISFGVTGTNLVPSELTMRLGLQPDRAFAKGATHHTPRGPRQRPFGVWAIDSRSHVSSDELAEHADYILRLLEPVRPAIEGIKRDPSLRTSVGIWWAPEEGQGGYTLKATVVSALCQYCDEIDFYFA